MYDIPINFFIQQDVESHDSCLNPRLSASATQPRSGGEYRSGGKLTDPGIESHTYRTDSNVLTTELTGRFFRRPPSKALKTLDKKAKDSKLKVYSSTSIDRQFFFALRRTMS